MPRTCTKGTLWLKLNFHPLATDQGEAVNFNKTKGNKEVKAKQKKEQQLFSITIVWPCLPCFVASHTGAIFRQGVTTSDSIQRSHEQDPV